MGRLIGALRPNEGRAWLWLNQSILKLVLFDTHRVLAEYLKACDFAGLLRSGGIIDAKCVAE